MTGSRRPEWVGVAAITATAITATAITAAAITAACTPGSDLPLGRPRVLWVNWDGAALDLIEPMLEAGGLPHLAALVDEGGRAEYAESIFPTWTASSFAALWTGAPPSVNGITGNTVPPPAEPVTAGVSGFSAELLRAEPIWAAVARQSRVAIALEAPQGYPLSFFQPGGRFGGEYRQRLKLLSGYARPLFRPGTLPDGGKPVQTSGAPAPPWEKPEGSVPPRAWRWPLIPEREAVWGSPEELWVWTYDDPEVDRNGYDAVMVAVGGDSAIAFDIGVRAAEPARLRPEQEALAPDFVAIPVKTAAGEVTFFVRCWEVAADGTPTCYRMEAGANLSNDDSLSATVEAAAPGFIGNAGSSAYQAGLFGPPLWEGGDGTAEARYLETAAMAIGHLNARGRAVARWQEWDLLITYLPYPDEAMHLWWGPVSPASDAYDPPLAEKLRPAVERVLLWVDAALGSLRAAAGDGVTTLVTSDHGYVPATRVFRPNRVLVEAGLLAIRRGDHGPEVDLEQTRVIYYRGDNMYLLVNGSDRRDGIVPTEQREGVLAAAERALLGFRDPDTGEAVVTATWRPTERPGLGGPTGGDLYFDVAPGFTVRADLGGDAVGPFRPAGEHRFDPRRPELRTIFVLAGPGIPPGSNLGPVRNIDAAPTVAAILGIEPPAQVVGTPIPAALPNR